MATTSCASIAGLDDYAASVDGTGGASPGEGGTAETTSSAGGTGGTGGAGGAVSACAYTATIEDAEPFAHWRFDEVAGSNGFVDAMSGPFLESSGAIAGRPAVICGDGYAVDFSDGEARMPANLATDFDFAAKASFSVEAWVVPPDNVFDPAGQAFDIARKLDDGSAQGWILRLDASQVKWRRIAGPSESINLFKSIDPQQNPAHVVATYDEGPDEMCAFVNGQPLGCTDAPILPLPVTSADLVVGSGPGGVVDELAIYTRALTYEEVEAHYDAGK